MLFEMEFWYISHWFDIALRNPFSQYKSIFILLLFMINIQYMYIVGKYKIYLYEL